jgi:excisionase family DNA binding protein
MAAPNHVPRKRISRALSIREFAEINGVSQSVVRRKVGDGSIPSYKIGGVRRIPVSYLEQLQRLDPVDSAIARLVTAAPPLTAEQRSRIGALLRIGDTRDVNA